MSLLPQTNQSKVILLITALVLVIISFFIIKPYIVTLLTSAVLAFLCYPVYIRVNKRIKNKSIASLIVMALLVILIAVPSYFLVQSIVSESRQLIRFAPTLTSLNLSPELSSLLADVTRKAAGFVAGKASEVLLSLPGMLLNLFILVYSLFYFFKEGPKIASTLWSVIPLPQRERNFLHKELKNVSGAVVYGLLLAGIIEGIAAAIGLAVFNVTSPILWGVIVVILSILPGVGASFVWVPAGIIKILTGNVVDGVGILLFGLIVLNFIELVLKQKFIEDKSKIHPVVILLGVLGGLPLFGFVGLILGPLILGLAVPF